MSKQDRQGVRKASDIEQKYDLSMLKEFGKGGTQQKEELSKITQEFSQFYVQVNARLQLLESVLLSVGSIYTTINEHNPSELFGGEWELIATGQLVLGHDSEGEIPELFQAEENCFIWKRIS
jgi:hypothetical protein